MFDFLDSWVQNPAIMVVLLLVGFVALVKGADWLVNGASGLAKRIGVSDLVIGLTVVAFGTSMPEFVVNIISAISQHSELAITNILGSNAINIFVILGITALIYPVSSKPQSRKVDIPVAILASFMVFFLAYYSKPQRTPGHLFGSSSNPFGTFAIPVEAAGSDCFISWIGGAVLLVFFVGYLIYLFRHSKDNTEENPSFIPVPIWKACLLILVGLVCLTLGGECIVKSATQMAHNLGISDAIIGLTVVALGTSLPELATSCMAAFKKNSDLALGNCVGSCIFNVFFVLGASACITPLAAYNGLWLDAICAFLAPVLVLFFVLNDREHKVSRLEGASLLLVYIAYLTYRLLTI